MAHYLYFEVYISFSNFKTFPLLGTFSHQKNETTVAISEKYVGQCIRKATSSFRQMFENTVPLSNLLSKLKFKKLSNLKFKNYTQKIVQFPTPVSQPGSHEFFHAGKVSWGRGTSINVSGTTYKREAPQGKILMFFLEYTLKIAFKWKLNPQMYTNREHFSKSRALFTQNKATFFYFQKRAGERPPSPTLPLYHTHTHTRDTHWLRACFLLSRILIIMTERVVKFLDQLLQLCGISVKSKVVNKNEYFNTLITLNVNALIYFRTARPNGQK